MNIIAQMVNNTQMGVETLMIASNGFEDNVVCIQLHKKQPKVNQFYAT